MKYWVGVTNDKWYEYLAASKPEEVNFWVPSAQPFRAISPGAAFLFKLHSPKNFIVGGGFFVRYSVLPISLAWSAFGEKNGADDFETFSTLVRQYHSKKKEVELDPLIGCTVLTEPFFFPENDWIPVPQDWSSNIVKGKTYNAGSGEGEALWEAVVERLQLRTEEMEEDSKVVSLAEDAPYEVDGPKYGKGTLIKARLGQGAFRVLVTDAYSRRCALTGEKTLPVLNAAHIKPFAKSGPHRTSNGLLLRSDLHTLMDLGYLTITQNNEVEVSSKIKTDYNNGREYYKLHGQSLVSLPARDIDRPGSEFIEWHNSNVFKG